MIIPAIVLFILGTLFGSFLSVVIYRIHENKKGIIFGKSQCPHCHKKLKVIDLIPLLSYIINRGKCRMCHKKISASYFMLELLCGLIFIVLYCYSPFLLFAGFYDFAYDGFLLLRYIYLAIISLFLIGIFIYDLKYLEVPEIFTFPAIGLVFVWSVFYPDPGFMSMAIGGAIAALFFGLQVWISKEQWLGAGDTQVGILMGMFLGWELFLVGLFVTYFVGSLLSILLLARKKVTRKSKIPFAPFIVTATFIVLFFGEYLYDLYLQTLF